MKMMTPRPTGWPNENSAPLPKYYQLREALRKPIQMLQAGQPIPSERELRLARDVSHITMRKALNPAQVEMVVVAAK